MSLRRKKVLYIIRLEKKYYTKKVYEKNEMREAKKQEMYVCKILPNYNNKKADYPKSHFPSHWFQTNNHRKQIHYYMPRADTNIKKICQLEVSLYYKYIAFS